MDYKKFYVAVRRYAKRKITRGDFLTDWKDAQRSQGIGIEKPETGCGTKGRVTA
ncbi:MAG: hypothetical protein LBI04_04295 [Treponema sp.]|jgi:hypothetical protein|nr:hypothetical protein [Treponema sp.]